MMSKKVDEKKIAFYMAQNYKVEISLEKNGYFFAKIPDLLGCMTEAESWKELEDNIEDAKKAWIITALKRGINIPLPREKSEKPEFVVKSKPAIRRPEKFKVLVETTSQQKTGAAIGYTLAA